MESIVILGSILESATALGICKVKYASNSAGIFLSLTCFILKFYHFPDTTYISICHYEDTGKQLSVNN